MYLVRILYFELVNRCYTKFYWKYFILSYLGNYLHSATLFLVYNIFLIRLSFLTNLCVQSFWWFRFESTYKFYFTCYGILLDSLNIIVCRKYIVGNNLYGYHFLILGIAIINFIPEYIQGYFKKSRDCLVFLY